MSPTLDYSHLACPAVNRPVYFHTPAATLPPSFTQPFHSSHHRHQATLRYNVSSATRPAASTVVSAPRMLLSANSAVARGVGSTSLLSTQSNTSLRPDGITSSLQSNNNTLSRKRPRTSPYPHAHRNKDVVNGSLPRDPQPVSPGAAVAFPVGVSAGDGGGRGSLWGPAGAHPAGAMKPPETEWACPTSSVATSTTSFHDGFSDVRKTGGSTCTCGGGEAGKEHGGA